MTCVFLEVSRASGMGVASREAWVGEEAWVGKREGWGGVALTAEELILGSHEPMTFGLMRRVQRPSASEV